MRRTLTLLLAAVSVAIVCVSLFGNTVPAEKSVVNPQQLKMYVDREKRQMLAGRLYGKIRVVSAGEDVKVRVVSTGEDLRVRRVSAGENVPGRWRFVEVGENFKVRFVDVGEDITVRFVQVGEGPAR